MEGSEFKGDGVELVQNESINAINRFSIKYPESEKDKYDKVVDYIYKSFKTGELNNPI